MPIIFTLLVEGCIFSLFYSFAKLKQQFLLCRLLGTHFLIPLPDYRLKRLCMEHSMCCCSAALLLRGVMHSLF